MPKSPTKRSSTRKRDNLIKTIEINQASDRILILKKILPEAEIIDQGNQGRAGQIRKTGLKIL